MTNELGEQCNRTSEVHPVDPFHSLYNLKNQFASVVICRDLEACNEWNGDVIKLPVVVSMGGVLTD